MRADAGELLANETRRFAVDLAARQEECADLRTNLDGEVDRLRSLVARAGALSEASAELRRELPATPPDAPVRPRGDGAPARARPAREGLPRLDYLEQLESPEHDRDGPPSPDRVGAAVWTLARDVVRAMTPMGSCVAVAGHGDEPVPGRKTLVLSPDSLGEDEAALAEVERLRTAGAEYLLIASTSTELRRLGERLSDRLGSEFELVSRRPSLLIHRLAGSHGAALRAAMRPARPSSEIRATQIAVPLAALVSSLLPADAPVVLLSDGREGVLPLGRPTTSCIHDRPGGPIPFDSAYGVEIVMALDAARRRGASYLVIPSSSYDRFDRCGELVHYVAHRCRPAAVRPQVGSVFELRDPV